MEHPNELRLVQPCWRHYSHQHIRPWILLSSWYIEISHICMNSNPKILPFLSANLGYLSIQLQDILPCPLEDFLEQDCAPFTQRLYLNNGSSVVIKCVLQLIWIFLSPSSLLFVHFFFGLFLVTPAISDPHLSFIIRSIFLTVHFLFKHCPT